MAGAGGGARGHRALASPSIRYRGRPRGQAPPAERVTGVKRELQGQSSGGSTHHEEVAEVKVELPPRKIASATGCALSLFSCTRSRCRSRWTRWSSRRRRRRRHRRATITDRRPRFRRSGGARSRRLAVFTRSHPFLHGHTELRGGPGACAPCAQLPIQELGCRVRPPQRA